MANGNFGSGDGFALPIRVEDAADFMALSAKFVENENYMFLQTTDIDMTGNIFVPIDVIRGSYNGNGYKVTNLKSSSEAFFSHNNRGTIHSLVFGEGCEWNRSYASTSFFGAGTFSNNNIGTITNCESHCVLSLSSSAANFVACGIAHGTGSVSGCKNYGAISSDRHACGVSGNFALQNAPSVEGCSNHGVIIANLASGISTSAYAGSTSKSSNHLSNCANYGQIIGTRTAGIAVNSGAIVENCINYGVIAGSYSSASIYTNEVSKSYPVLIKNCFALNNTVTIRRGGASPNRYSRIAINTLGFEKLTIENCYALDTMSLTIE